MHGSVRRLEEDGWYVVRMTGSHRVLRHPVKKGVVVVAGHESKDVARGTLKSIWKQAQMEN